jgi:putative nucleotidyltransferase with HDIG domain
MMEIRLRDGWSPVHAGASGHRLLRALEALERFPTTAGWRDHVLYLIESPGARAADLVGAIESDPGITIAILRAAGSSRASSSPGVSTAIERLSRCDLRAAVDAIPVSHFMARRPAPDNLAERIRRHAVGTRRIALELGAVATESMPLAALLHDIGKVALMLSCSGYEGLLRLPGCPEDRIARERHCLGLDHAVVGGVLARRLRLPDAVAEAVERHHSPDATGDAAVVRLADMLEHRAAGGQPDPAALAGAIDACGLDHARVAGAAGELSFGGRVRPRRFERAPAVSGRRSIRSR